MYKQKNLEKVINFAEAAFKGLFNGDTCREGTMKKIEEKVRGYREEIEKKLDIAFLSTGSL